jgi:hypothetical protein
MEKICLIQQEAGIGDVFFAQNIAKKYINQGYRVIWPLLPFVYSIQNYFGDNGIEYYDNSKKYPYDEIFKQYVSKKQYFYDDNLVFLPIGISPHLIGGKVMQSKYTICGLDYKTWKNNISIKRNFEKENNLFKDLNLTHDENYCLVNENFVTPPDIQYKNVSSVFENLDNKNLKYVNMKLLSNYSVFDWCGVIENANYIVTVDTCIMYFMEFLNLKSKKNYCFPRNGNYTINQINELFETQWTYCL